jgi:hypothetical protein
VAACSVRSPGGGSTRFSIVPIARHDGCVASGDTPGWVADGRAILRVRQDPAALVDTSSWPATVPAVEQMLCAGLELARA